MIPPDFVCVCLYVLRSERVMPYFTQEPLSYLSLPTIRNAYKAFSINITFRPDNVDGENATSRAFHQALPG